MNWLHEWVLAPFVGFGFMRRALLWFISALFKRLPGWRFFNITPYESGW